MIETGKVTIICESNHHQQQHNMREFNLAPGTYYTDETSVFWNDDYNNTGAWFCNVYLRYDNDSISRYTNPFNQANGKHLVNYVSGVIWYVYDSNQGEWAIWTEDNRQNHAEIDTIPYPQKCRKSAVSGRFFYFRHCGGVGRTAVLPGGFALFNDTL